MAEILGIKNLHVSYRNVEVLHGIDLSVEEGEIVSLLGANGAGKSTTLLAISGLVRSSEGTIFLDTGSHPPAFPPTMLSSAEYTRRRRAGGSSNLTVYENLTPADSSVRMQRRSKDPRLVYRCFQC
jgi:branched-chain amino acid transport system ATP-binding protein